MEPEAPSIEMPRYKCHKEVWALKIKSVAYDYDAARAENRETDGSMTLTFENELYAPLKIQSHFVPRHEPARPQPGWYFVLYADGYKSYSPAKAFEEGYTLIERSA